MKTRFTALLNVFALFCALGFAAAHAQVPKTINYQGYLTTPSGVVVNGNVVMTLKLYDAANAVTELYAETHSSVTVANGIFNVQIGSVTPIGLNFTAPYFLGVTIGTDPEMTPRRPLSSAPYAVTAENIAPGGNLYLSDSTATVGNVFKDGARFMHNTGHFSTFLGKDAGNLTADSSGQNTGIGANALRSLSTFGQLNTAIGVESAQAIADGVANTAIGSEALYSNVSGDLNTAVGFRALLTARSSGNIALGTQAGLEITTGGNNIMIGNQGVAAESDTIRLGDPTTHTRTFLSGTVNTADINATGAITTTSTLTAANITSGGNISLGGSTATSGNVFKDGERFMHNAGGLTNTFLGRQSGNFTLTNTLNVGVGTLALSALTTGGGNTAVGANAARSVQSGGSNVAVGYLALDANQSGNDNTAVGNLALYDVTSSSNIGLGKYAGRNLTTGGGNIMIGNVGVAGESDTIRIGSSSHTRTFLSGTVKTAAIEATAPISTTSTVTATGGLNTNGTVTATGAISTGSTVNADGGLNTNGTVTATGAISTGSTVNAVGGISTAQSVTVATGTAPKTVILPSSIGVNLPASGTTNRPIVLQAQGLEWIGFRDSTGLDKWHFNNRNGGLNFARTAQEDGQLFLATNGSVGIGTDTPTRAKLEVSGMVFTGVQVGDRGLSANGLGTVNAAGPVPLSIYATDGIASTHFWAVSDQRIKRITGRSNAARDLATISAIEVTDYTHIDTPQRGDKAHKKVIAQQVEKVFPQAVNKITDVVPDIYQPATVKDGWIALEDLAKVNLKKGDRVRLIGKATQGVHEVLDVADGRFRTAFKADSDTIFVYGREVNDFRTVDYEAIAMLNVSATQELHRRLEAEAAKVRAQGAEIAQLKQQLAQLSDLNAKVAWLMAQKAPAKP